MGEATAWRRLDGGAVNNTLVPAAAFLDTHENKLPRAPPSSTISYRESMGLAKDAL